MVAPIVLDGPINGVSFQAYVDEILVPELRPGDIVVIDNFGSHKGACATRSKPPAPASFIFRRTAPKFNPMENAFSKLKALLRKAAEKTVERSWNTIGALLPAFTQLDCANFFATAGYGPAC